MMSKYKEPAIAIVLRIFGWIGLVGGLLFLLLGLASGTPLYIGLGIGEFNMAVFCFLFAGLREASERSAFHTERCAAFLEKMALQKQVELAAAASATRKPDAMKRTTRIDMATP